MKKIILLVLIIFSVNILFACNDYNDLESKWINYIKEEVSEYLCSKDDESVDMEPPSKLNLDRIILTFNRYDKYLLNLIENDTEEYICGYMNLEIKDTLDNVKVIVPDGDRSWHVRCGIDLYLKKYKIAIEDGLIDGSKNTLEWKLFNNKDEMLEQYEDKFLVSINKVMKMELINLKTNKKSQVVSFLEIESLNFFDDLYDKKNLFVMTNNIKNSSYISALDLFSISEYYSAHYIEKYSRVYVNSLEKEYKESRTTSNDSNIVLKKYKVIDDYYYYELSEIMKKMES